MTLASPRETVLIVLQFQCLFSSPMLSLDRSQAGHDVPFLKSTFSVDVKRNELQVVSTLEPTVYLELRVEKDSPKQEVRTSHTSFPESRIIAARNKRHTLGAGLKH